LYIPPVKEHIHVAELNTMLRKGHEPETFSYLEHNLNVLNADGKEPNYELPASLRPPYLRADIKEITENGMVYINFSEPILLPWNNTAR